MCDRSCPWLWCVVIGASVLAVAVLTWIGHRESHIQGPPRPAPAPSVELVQWEWAFEQNADARPLLVRIRWAFYDSVNVRHVEYRAAEPVDGDWMQRSPKAWSAWVRARGDSVAANWEVE